MNEYLGKILGLLQCGDQNKRERKITYVVMKMSPGASADLTPAMSLLVKM